MKKEMNLAMLSRTAILSVLILFACLTAAVAQTVIPTVCIIPTPKSGTTTLTANAAAGLTSISLDSQGGTLPQHLRLIINPGGATEESVQWAVTSGNSFYVLRNTSLAYAHSAGETVQWFTDATVVWGYNNTSSSTVIIPRGVSNYNYFFPGALVYSAQPTTFLSGVHTAFSFDFPLRDVTLTWALNNGSAIASKNTPSCATISYQGRLNDAGSAANGNYDLQFTAYDSLTGGIPQSDAITIENTQVTNGIFTVQLNFSAAFISNDKTKYLEIGVRPGAATGTDPFTLLTPRQPITPVPYAVNAQTANNVSGGFVQLPQTNGVPSPFECNDASQYGKQKIDATNNKLYICTSTGWKFTTLQ